MNFITALKTDPDEWAADTKAAMETVLAEISERQAKGEDKPARKRSWQYSNSNFGMGM